jgi:hypothetical protein
MPYVRPRRVDAPILPAPVLQVDHVQWEYPGLSRSQLYKMSALGEIEILKIGKRAVVRRSDIEALLDAAPRLHPRASAAPPAEPAEPPAAQNKEPAPV